MLNEVMRRNFVNIILEAQRADVNQLTALRKKILMAAERFGARRFVTVTAEVLKDSFSIEGCNDARIPLKQIFAISLEELEEDLVKQEYKLAKEHPLVMLSQDHKDNIKKLKALRLSLGGLNLNKDTTGEAIKNKLKQTQDYYAELDLHIRKEEDVFFPVLEENGMQEHPENLRQEHKGFREVLSKIIEDIGNLPPRESDLVIEEIKQSKEKFISDISNHIFRETHIFYPASLEFITDTNQWEKIKDGFKNIS